MTRVERFMSHVVVQPDGCWHWTGSLNRHGYGFWQIRGEGGAGAHRWAYRLLVGPIPEGLVLDHLCRIRHCVNPAHLEPVTPRENILRSTNHVAAQMRQTHCKRGHEFTAENTLIYGGSRECRTCSHEKAVRRYAARLRRAGVATFVSAESKTNPGSAARVSPRVNRRASAVLAAGPQAGDRRDGRHLDAQVSANFASP